jgi:hypothetical protein
MTHVQAFRSSSLRRRREPDPATSALVLYSLIAASGFAVGWAAQALGAF